MSKLLYIFFTHQETKSTGHRNKLHLSTANKACYSRGTTHADVIAHFFTFDTQGKCDTSVSLCLMFCISSEMVYRYLLYLPSSVIVLYQILVLTTVMNIITTDIILSSKGCLQFHFRQALLWVGRLCDDYVTTHELF
ncbi:unnamed protein product [Clavelina lepadiformis]|uniref:Uncharacterized protein n=1 Tax=Clavelina lepadiformis TaxID=159417 RepID=A0ABP0H1C2_CLALP